MNYASGLKTIQTMSKRSIGRIKIIEERCKLCGLCVMACPLKLIRFTYKAENDNSRTIEFQDPEGKCKGCGVCFKYCPDCAIEVYKYSKEF